MSMAENKKAGFKNANDTVLGAMVELGHRASAAAKILALASAEQKNQALAAIADNIRAGSKTILAANKLDVERARQNKMAASFVDRLTLNEDRVEQMAQAVEAIAQLDDPVGALIARWQQPNGLEISRVRVPIGVIGIIYESRPNVTADAGALCLKSGN
ncbi:Gamma-glutamyl phosphate reductase, partial [hydrothermal vent metagenome]